MRVSLWLSVLLTGSAFAAGVDIERYAYKSEFHLACEKSALNVHAGKVLKVEFKIDDDQPVYEFDIRAADGVDWDVTCDADKNEIIEIEQEVPSVNHPLFLSKKHIDEKQARAIVMDAWPGDILEIEYEIEPDGAASYEFDIHTYKGVDMKVEVDASSGDIVEQNEELWQEGYE